VKGIHRERLKEEDISNRMLNPEDRVISEEGEALGGGLARSRVWKWKGIAPA